MFRKPDWPGYTEIKLLTGLESCWWFISWSRWTICSCYNHYKMKLQPLKMLHSIERNLVSHILLLLTGGTSNGTVWPCLCSSIANLFRLKLVSWMPSASILSLIVMPPLQSSWRSVDRYWWQWEGIKLFDPFRFKKSNMLRSLFLILGLNEFHLWHQPASSWDSGSTNLLLTLPSLKNW